MSRPTRAYRIVNAAFYASLISLGLFCIVFGFPILGQVAGVTLAREFGCQVSARGATECLAWGLDIGPSLYAYLTLGMIGLAPLALLAGFSWLLKAWTMLVLSFLPVRAWLQRAAAPVVAGGGAGGAGKGAWWLVASLVLMALAGRVVVVDWPWRPARVSPRPAAVVVPAGTAPSKAEPAKATSAKATSAVAPALPQASVPFATVSAPVVPAPAPVVQAMPLLPDGRAGVVEAMRAGMLRLATAADLDRWRALYRATGGRPGDGLEGMLQSADAYVIQADMVLPGGLHGADAVVFLLEPRVPFPRGDAGHSAILDLATGACTGVLCPRR